MFILYSPLEPYTIPLYTACQIDDIFSDSLYGGILVYNMALKGKNSRTKNDKGEEVEAFIAEFTNGTLEQLNDLATYLDKEGLELPKSDPERKLAVVKIGIA